uniref:Putative small protein n=1 Tax=Grapevine leafroll-associated virus 3 TaxID=55951 RepID=A0A3Q9HGF4_9CLOS|nr:putative small protein [Grapevine leafroll-associated virus 3]
MRHLDRPVRVAIHYCLVRSEYCDGWDVFIGITLMAMCVSYYLYALISIFRNRN